MRMFGSHALGTSRGHQVVRSQWNSERILAALASWLAMYCSGLLPFHFALFAVSQDVHATWPARLTSIQKLHRLHRK